MILGAAHLLVAGWLGLAAVCWQQECSPLAQQIWNLLPVLVLMLVLALMRPALKRRLELMSALCQAPRWLHAAAAAALAHCSKAAAAAAAGEQRAGRAVAAPLALRLAVLLVPLLLWG